MKPKRAKREPMEPKGSQSEPRNFKKHHLEANGSQKWAKGRPKGTKSEPPSDQNASKERPSGKVSKREQKGSPHQDEMEAFWAPFLIKIHPPKYSKNDH